MDKKIKIYQPLPYRKDAEITNGPYKKEGQTKCPIKNSNVKERSYIATCVDYKYKNKKGKWIDVKEYVLIVKWLD